MANETSSSVPRQLLLGAAVILIGAKIGLARWESGALAANAIAPDPAAHQFALDARFINAGRAGNVAGAQAALEAGASVNAFDSHGRTALSEALRVRAWEIADLCLAKPFSPRIVWAGGNGRDSQIGDAALFWAARQSLSVERSTSPRASAIAAYALSASRARRNRTADRTFLA